VVRKGWNAKMADKILLVDDEPAVLNGYKRLLYRQFQVETAPSGASALALMRVTGPYSVVVSDMRMPGMNGAEFLAAAREKAPSTVRILLTGYTDMDAAIEAVNKGNIFRFLTKPCPRDVLVQAIDEGIAQYHTAETEKELAKKAKVLERTEPEWDAVAEAQAENFQGLAGLPGTAQARSYLRELFGSDAQAFVVLFKLTAVHTIEERYGEEGAAEYLLGAVQSLKEGFSPTDRLFQWSRDVLMAVIRRQVSPGAIRMEITRLTSDSQPRFLEYNGRKIMVTYAFTFDLLPVRQFSSVEELFETFNTKMVGRL
jgi:FixJ family two-component response regulator